MKIGRVFATFQTDLKYTEHYIARELARDGHKTVFITSDKYLEIWKKYLKNYDTSGYYKYKDFEVHRLKAFFPGEKAIIKEVGKLYNLLLNSKLDILHLYGLGNFTTIMVLWILKFKGKNTPPVVISDHTDTRTHRREGIFAEAYYLFFKIQLKFLHTKIFKVITFNKVGIEVLTKRFGISQSKFKIIPLGYDQDTYYYRPELKNKEEKMVIGYAGKIESKKRVDYLMNVINSMDLADSVKLIIVGMKDDDSYCNHLRDLADQLQIEVEFRPFATSEELAEFYNYIDLAVYPGGISITTIEASGCGVPVVIYESIKDLDERVEKGRGKLFKTADELKSHLQFYFNQYKEKKIGNRHIEEVTKNVSSWKHIKDQYINIYEDARNAK